MFISKLGLCDKRFCHIFVEPTALLYPSVKKFLISGVPGVPNFPGQANLPGGLKAKTRHQPKYRLPVLNWSALRPNQVAGTIFNELDDDSVLNEVRML